MFFERSTTILALRFSPFIVTYGLGAFLSSDLSETPFGVTVFSNVSGSVFVREKACCENITAEVNATVARPILQNLIGLIMLLYKRVKNKFARVSTF